MDFKQDITPVDVIKNKRVKNVHLEEHILEIFILIDKQIDEKELLIDLLVF